MAADESQGSPRQRDGHPPLATLVAVVAIPIFGIAVVLAPVSHDVPISVPLALPYLLFVPGYVVAACLLPGGGGIGGVKRVALSVGLSLTIVPLAALGLVAMQRDIHAIPVVLVVSGLVLVMTLIAAGRRWRLLDAERFRLVSRTGTASERTGARRQLAWREVVVTVLFVVAVVVLIGVVGYAAMTPQTDSYSAIYLLTEDEDGELVADDYPTEFELGEEREVIVGIDNHEHRPVNYTVVVAEQDIESNESEVVVDEQRELDRFDIRLEHDETRLRTDEFQPTITGRDVRIVWLLYLDGDVPDDPSVKNADYYVDLWVEVTDDEA
ncbi:DUF1616 domain-containing protein [Halosolutus gelatinilyticus]|uniref:DUF1616 domain-containing protein n=1 Tax=Halosolutus gelatinilyticus TaxID=2931975 RepID=UPI001FF0EFFA|nr:DUF1616 domain-containing protein [Halosolutus gelatinilyticus]